MVSITGLPEERKVMIGLEVHFQLKGKKLFCECSTESYGVRKETFERNLSTTASEMGHYDPAAEYEKFRNRTFRYVATDNSCLVEADEEPPHEPNSEAMETGLKVARALNCSTLDSIAVMRKIVVDGSNTSGFQRTAVVGLDGSIQTSRGTVRISSVCVEEDSARKLEEQGKDDDVVYSLDRLGIPLLEIATEPDIVDSEHAVEVARAIGYLVASTGKARRQVDSIRQDVNLSLGFGRVEMKGIQKLSLIEKSISHEIERQRNMKVAMGEFLNRGGLKTPFRFVDVRDQFSHTGSNMLKKAFKNGTSIFCSLASNLSGLLKNKDFRVGKDLSDIAKAFGLGGILHTDELPAFGVTAEEVDGVRKSFLPDVNDALVLIVTTKERALKLSDAFTSRVRKLSEIDFSETRGPNEDGTTKFLRPLPGKERMYPETDIPFWKVSKEMKKRVESFIPKSQEKVAEELSGKYSISPQDAGTIASNFMVDEFVENADTLGDGKLAARIMLQTVPEMERKYNRSFNGSELSRLLKISSKNRWSRNNLELAMESMIEGNLSAEESEKKVSSLSMTDAELRNLVEEIIMQEGKGLKPGALIAEMKKRSSKTFDPKEAVELLLGSK